MEIYRGYNMYSKLETMDAKRYIANVLAEWQAEKAKCSVIYEHIDTSAWLFVFVYRSTYYGNPVPEYFEDYSVGDLKEARSLIEFYGWTEDCVKVIVRDTSADVTDQVFKIVS